MLNMVMMDEIVHILVFKTDVNSTADKERLTEVFLRMDEVEEWSVDLEDVDRVLRVVSYENDHAPVIQQMKALGFHCQELDW